MTTSVSKLYTVMITAFLQLIIYLRAIPSYHLHVTKPSNFGMLHQGKNCTICILFNPVEILTFLSFSSYCIKTLSGHLDWVRSVSPSEDGRYLVTASNDQVGYKSTRELNEILCTKSTILDCKTLGCTIRRSKNGI